MHRQNLGECMKKLTCLNGTAENRKLKEAAGYLGKDEENKLGAVGQEGRPRPVKELTK